MKKYIVSILYILLSCYLAFVQIVVFIFNPVFSLEKRNGNLETIMYLVHGLIFIVFVYGVIFFAKKLWIQLKK